MLPAHYYPAFKKYPHFAGNYGNAWWQQKEEFESFHGPILMTPKKKRPILKKRTPDFSSSKEIPEKNLPYAMQAADLPMLEPCRIASLMPWSYPKWDTMRLL